MEGLEGIKRQQFIESFRTAEALGREKEFLKSVGVNIDEINPEFFEKGGEGSKGGKIIGHTRSGKPIYDSATHPEHKNFTKQDHEDAQYTHSIAEDAHSADYGRMDMRGGPNGHEETQKYNSLYSRAKNHRNQAKIHESLSKEG